MEGTDNAEKLFNENYAGMVKGLSYYARKCKSEEFEDALQNMLLNCWRACKKYDRTCGHAKFH